MHRTDGDQHQSNLFSEGDPTVPRLPTQIDKDWLNAAQEEIVNAILDNGDALVKGTWTQLANVLAMVLGEPGGRLVPDNTGLNPVIDSTSNTIFYIPYKHARVSVWNGSRWLLRTIPAGGTSQTMADTTKSPAATAASTNYDIFCWDDAGTLRATRGPAWTSGTARGTGAGTTELERKDGRWVNKIAITNGPAAQRGLYLGTVRTNAANTAYVDTVDERLVWNMYNRIARTMRAVAETTDSWSYSSATIREANANTANRLKFVIGLDEDLVSAEVVATAGMLGTSGAQGYVGVGLDSTSARATGCLWDSLNLTTSVGTDGITAPLGASWKGKAGIGSHFLSWLEQADGSGNVTFFGDSGATTLSGIHGELMA